MTRKDFTPSELETKQNDQPFLAELYDAAVSGRVLSGQRAGQQAVHVGDLENYRGDRNEKCSLFFLSVRYE